MKMDFNPDIVISKNDTVFFDIDDIRRTVILNPTFMMFLINT